MPDSSQIKVIVMTGDGLRHRFVANYLAENFNVLGVVSETTRALPQSEAPEEAEIIRRHFQERDEKEKEYFGNHRQLVVPAEKFLAVERGHSNNPEVFEWVKSRNPDYVLLYGTSIIKEPLLSFYENKTINMHLGLSPYYRGSGTNFWPLVYRQPECVGVTVHLATLKVDAGAILGQARPESAVSDRCHDLGCKTIISGARVLADAVKAYVDQKLTPRPQNLAIGKVFKNKDFNVQAVLDMWRNFDTGMMVEYLQNKADRDTQYPLVELQ